LCALTFGVSDANADSFGFTGSPITWVAPTTGLYDLTVFGAAGGGSDSANGGLGSEASGIFSLTAGDQLTIVVGGQGGNGNFETVYGGGGGGSGFSGVDGEPRQVGSAGLAGDGPNGGAGGLAGSGGGGGSTGSSGGGGGGIVGGGSDGAGAGTGAGFSGFGAFGAFSFDGGVGAGTGLVPPQGDNDGGYGGGSLVDIAGLDALILAGVNSGDGSATITEVSATAPDAPSTLALFAASACGLALAKRRRAIAL
jgi:hypothetical protein